MRRFEDDLEVLVQKGNDVGALAIEDLLNELEGDVGLLGGLEKLAGEDEIDEGAEDGNNDRVGVRERERDDGGGEKESAVEPGKSLVLANEAKQLESSEGEPKGLHDGPEGELKDALEGGGEEVPVGAGDTDEILDKRDESVRAGNDDGGIDEEAVFGEQSLNEGEERVEEEDGGEQIGLGADFEKECSHRWLVAN